MFERRFTPAPADIDELGHVNNAVWVRWIQEMATSHWIAVADPAHVAAYVWVVVRHEIDYLGNVGPGEAVTARTWVADAPRRALRQACRFHCKGRQGEGPRQDDMGDRRSHDRAHPAGTPGGRRSVSPAAGLNTRSFRVRQVAAIL